MKRPKLKHTLLPIACLSGLASCYPITPVNPNIPGRRPSGLKSAAELEAAAKLRAEAENSKKTALQRSKDRLEREERERLMAEKDEAAAYRARIDMKANDEVNGVVPKQPVDVPKVIKFAAPVPNKKGFVYNPYTNNQVDVRGIPSGTKVRDPHDPNPTHIFRVP